LYGSGRRLGAIGISLRIMRLRDGLCPALFKYFRAAPKEIYVRAEAK
jgi:hypothetical protein